MTSITSASPEAAPVLGRFVRLNPPEGRLSSLEKHAADALRFGWRWKPGSPPGVYLDNDGRPTLHGFSFDDEADSDNSTEFMTMFDSVSSAFTDTSIQTSDDDSPFHNDTTRGQSASNVNVHVSTKEGNYGYLARDKYVRLNILTQKRMLDNLADNPQASSPLYTLDLETLQHSSAFSRGSQQTPFRLLIDTGSNTTWVRGYGLCKIIKSWTSAKGVPTFNITRVTAQEMGSRPLLLHHGRYFTFSEGQPVKQVDATECDGYVRYGLDNEEFTQVLLSLPSHMNRTWTIPSAFSWGGNPLKSQLNPISFDWKAMGVAIAGDVSETLNQGFDGVLGLGTARYQGGYIDVSTRAYGSSRRDVPSFSQALLDGNKLPPAPRDPATAKRPELITYILIGMRETDPSYIAWQAWPSEEELKTWSRKIYVNPTSTESWVIRVERLRIWGDFTEEEIRDGVTSLVKTKEPLADIQLAGWPFVLDTGSACSYFPETPLQDMIRQMNLGGPGLGELAAPYRVPKSTSGKGRLDDKGFIQWTFLSNQDHVTSYTALPPFLADNNGDGLIWPKALGGIDEREKRKVGILGLNYFRSVYVALHHPRTGDGAPFVTLAGQTKIRVKVPDVVA